MVCVYLYTYTLPPLSFAMNRKKNENTSRGRKNSNFVPASTSCAVFIRLCVVYISFNSISAACCRSAVAGFCYFFLLLNDIFVFISFYPSPFPSSLPLIVRCLSSLSVVIIILLLYCRSSVALYIHTYISFIWRMELVFFPHSVISYNANAKFIIVIKSGIQYLSHPDVRSYMTLNCVIILLYFFYITEIFIRIRIWPFVSFSYKCYCGHNISIFLYVHFFCIEVQKTHIMNIF